MPQRTLVDQELIGIQSRFQNKEFVYRGLEFEKLPAFQQRISDEFPQAQILPTNTQPDETICNQDGQFIQICCVKPVPDEIPQDQQHVTSMEGLTVPSKIQKSQDRMSISKFVYDRPFHQGKRDKGNEFKVRPPWRVETKYRQEYLPWDDSGTIRNVR